MAYRFGKHYTRDEARALLPQIRSWLEEIRQLRSEIEKLERRMAGLMQPGCDLGGPLVNKWISSIADMKELLMEFYQRDIQIKDLDRGLIDFPAVINGKEVYLCWEHDEPDVEFWHDLDAGYAGREPLD